MPARVALDLARHRRRHVLPGARVVPRPLPLTDVLEHRAVRLVPPVHRRAPHRVEHGAAVAPGDRAEGDRRIRRAKGGHADVGDRLTGDPRNDAQRIDVRRLALVRAHAGRGVALDMLDRAVAFAEREAEVAGGDVVLQVDEHLAALERSPRGHQPHGARGRLLGLLQLRRLRQLGREPGRRRGVPPRARALLEARTQRKRAVARARRAFGLARFARQEHRACVVVARHGARLRLQVDRGVPAARDAHEIARQGVDRTLHLIA